jgi:hypothetical protein
MIVSMASVPDSNYEPLLMMIMNINPIFKSKIIKLAICSIFLQSNPFFPSIRYINEGGTEGYIYWDGNGG